MTSKRVIVCGSKGALGAACISAFKSQKWWVGSIDTGKNELADASITVNRNSSLQDQEENVLKQLEVILSGNQVDAIICVAGGWAGGNVASTDFVKNCELTWKQSVFSSVIAAKVASKVLKEGGLISLTGASAALESTPGMIGYGMAKAAVHHLTKSLAAPDSGLPPNSTVVSVLPEILDTQMNRKWMPDADKTTWTPLDHISSLFIKWCNNEERPLSGSLVRIVTKGNATQLQMDVDLLRPGNVPISPNTVLWFEFLLKPDLLEEHLKKPNPDPVPTDLLIKFLTLSVEPHIDESFEKTRNFKCSKRHLSMKILALKIVAFWKWDLEIIESKLPLQLQYVLFRDLLCLTDELDANVSAPMMHHNLDFEQLKDEQIFAVSLYHRWTLHIIVNSPMVSKIILCSTTANVESADEIMSKVMDDEAKTEIVLKKIINLRKENITIPAFHNITPPSESEDHKQDWERGVVVPTSKFYCQIHYDLGMYKLYREMTREATEFFVLCNNFYAQQDNFNAATDGYCKVNETNLVGLCRACGVNADKDQNLILQFYSVIHDNYSNVINVLQIDNVKREIPLTYRDSLELDLASSLANGKFTATRDLVFQIQTLNAIRRLFEGVSYPSIFDYVTKLKAFAKGSNILTKSLKSVLNTASSIEKENIRLFLFVLFYKCDSSFVYSITSDVELSSLFNEREFQEARTRFETDIINFPDLFGLEEEREERIRRIGNVQLNSCLLERHIINTYDPYKLKDLIGRFSSLTGVRPLMNVFNKWKLSPNMCQDISKLPNQFLREYCYIVFAKTKELLEFQNYEGAMNLISVARDEVKKHKFSQLLIYESLYVNMVELSVTWPADHINRTNLALSCKDCLMKINQRSEVQYQPRNQIRDLSVITLLNVKRDFLNTFHFSKRPFPYFELSLALTTACADVEKFKGTKKFSKEAWDLIMPAFYVNNNQQHKQGNADRDWNKSALTQYFLELRDSCVIDVALSLLSKIQNVVRDEPQLELQFLYTPSWPATITNSNAYSPDFVLEMIADVLEKVLRYQPQNRHWLKLSADVNFVKGHHSTALKNYLQALVATTDYFQQLLVPKNVVEDFVYRKMIKCCMFLQCFTQAAIFCQFLDEVDYTTAFKCLSETMSADATDCYYDYIWDVNILEFLIALHTKRNEHTKKQKVIEAIGLLELNSNNNEEIKQEASKLRKLKFLRAVAKQYMCY